jgi:Na+-translocating ferredoxin:NAD+ oxidoreductase RNF subunit RnfB
MGAAKDKIKQIYEMLPQLNCGLCGFEGCGQFAKAVTEGRASPFGCRQDPWAGYRISEIMGIRAPLFNYRTVFGKPVYPQRTLHHASIGSLRAEIDELSKRIEGIIDKIDSLGRKKGKGNRKSIKKGGDFNAKRRRNRPTRSGRRNR